jgi:hypothetical protein
MAASLQVAQQLNILQEMTRQSERKRVLSSICMVTAVSPFFCVPHMCHNGAIAQSTFITLTLEAYSC